METEKYILVLLTFRLHSLGNIDIKTSMINTMINKEPIKLRGKLFLQRNF